jgi:hypothetical protein
LLSSLSIARRWAAATLLGALAAGCSAAGTPSGPTVGTSASSAARTANDNRTLANGFGTPLSTTVSHANGWISPDHKRRHKRALFYWGNYDSSSITILSSTGTVKGQITSGLYNPERLFVDKQGDVYATNIGYNGSNKNSITGYKPGQKTPFITITTGVNRPTGLTVDGAGTIYCANVGNDTITVYPKGQTSPSLTIPFFAEYLATDSNDNLYASGSTVDEFAPGSTQGKNLNLNGAGNAIEVDRSGNVILINGADIDYYPAGKTQPSKTIPISGGSPFSLSLSGDEKTLYLSLETSAGPFSVQSVAYPNGSTLTTKFTGTGDWPIAASPDNALGN